MKYLYSETEKPSMWSIGDLKITKHYEVTPGEAAFMLFGYNAKYIEFSHFTDLHAIYKATSETIKYWKKCVVNGYTNESAWFYLNKTLGFKQGKKHVSKNFRHNIKDSRFEIIIHIKED